MTGPVTIARFLDEQTVLAVPHDVVHDSLTITIFKSPLCVVDLSTGAVREIVIPAEALHPVSLAAPKSPAMYLGISGDEIEGTSELAIVGHHLALYQNNPLENSCVDVWNWRTGRKCFHRLLHGKLAGTLGDRIWVRPLEPSSDSETYELLEISTGSPVPCSIPINKLDLRSCPRSSDGRFVVEPHVKEGCVWNVETNEVLFNVDDVFAAAFSSDGQLMASVSRVPVRRSPRIWQVHDLATGRVLAEHQQVREPGVLGEGALLRFTDRDASVVAGFGPNFGAVSAFGKFDEPAIWRWREGGFELRKPSLQTALHDMFSDSLPRLFVDGRDVVDLDTGRRIAALSNEDTLLFASPDGKRGIIESGSSPLRDRLVVSAAKISDWPANVPRSDGRSQLRDLRTGRTVATAKPWFLSGDYSISPMGGWLVESDAAGLTVWSLTPRLPWRRALLYSLLVTGTALVFAVITRVVRRAFQRHS